MTIRRLLIAAAALTISATAFAALSPQNDAWGKSGVQFLLTEEEAAKWKTIKTDAEAQAFIDLFWARRDPTPATPRNEFREQIEERIKYADAKFTPARKKMQGQQTERGMMLIVFGMPHRVAKQHAAQQFGASGSAGRLGVSDAPSGRSTPNTDNIRGATSDRVNSYETWVYEGEQVRNLFGVPRAEFTFVDRTNTEEFGLERGGPVDVAAARRNVVASFITQPQLTRAPEFTNVPMGGTQISAAAVAPIAVVTSLTTPALAAAITEVKAASANPYASSAYAVWSEGVTPQGEYFVPVSVYVPKTSPAASAQDVTFFGQLEDESGKPVLAFEEQRKLTATKEDFFVDKSLTGLPAGKYRGWFGVAANGKTLAVVPAQLHLAGTLDKSAAAVSPLILSNNIYVLTDAQRPTDPYSFGGTKVVPKGDKVFRAASDELWYFFELRNPGLNETGAPKVQIKVDITGKLKDGTAVKKGAPLSEAEVMQLKGVEGHYAVGNAFPLTTFKPGDYTINVRVIDTVTKASYNLSDTFRVE
jgi:GWxTD domain-containing protein